MSLSCVQPTTLSCSIVRCQRRFQLKLELTRPDRNQIADYFSLASKRFSFSFGISPKMIADKLIGASYSDLENFTSDIARAYVLALPEADAKQITEQQTSILESYVAPHPSEKAQG